MSPVLKIVLAVGAAAMLINVAGSIDWGQPGAFVAVELLRRVGFLCLFLVGASTAAVPVHSAPLQSAGSHWPSACAAWR